MSDGTTHTTLDDYVLKRLANHEYAMRYLRSHLEGVQDEDGKELLAWCLNSIARAYGLQGEIKP